MVSSMGDIVSSQFNTCLVVLEAINLFSKGCSGSIVEEHVITKELKAESSKWLLEWRTSPGKVIIAFLCLKLLSVDAPPCALIKLYLHK